MEALTKRLEVAVLKTLRFSLGAMRMDRIRNVYIRKTAQVRGFGHVQRRDRILKMELPGRRQR